MKKKISPPPPKRSAGANPPERPRPVAKRHRRATVHADGNGPARIMVVDDDSDTVAVLCHHLEREGFAPIPARSGAECLKLAKRGKVDVILLDLMMPKMDGFAVLRALKNDPRTAEIPVIMVTARDDIDARAEGMRLGVSDFLPKPVFRRQLALRIQSQLDIVRTARAAAAALLRFERPKRK
ncbi:MAG: response regulator [Candidatus Binataceae bacterium]